MLSKTFQIKLEFYILFLLPSVRSRLHKLKIIRGFESQVESKLENWKAIQVCQNYLRCIYKLHSTKIPFVPKVKPSVVVLPKIPNVHWWLIGSQTESFLSSVEIWGLIFSDGFQGIFSMALWAAKRMPLPYLIKRSRRWTLGMGTNAQLKNCHFRITISLTCWPYEKPLTM